METALVSVIIPIYKVSEYLDVCVQSARSQTYRNLEIILVDDGSPDDCPQKCDEWAERDVRIKVIHKKNGGLSDARNAGLDVATGKYIYFLDGDDAIKPDLIETVVPYLESGVDLVAFNWERVYPDGKVKPCLHELGTYNLSLDNRVSFYFDTLLSYKIGWEAWSRIFRRDLIEAHQLRFADNRRIFAEDLFFSLCYCAHAKTVVSIPESLYCYSVRETSIMGQNQTKLNAGRMNELGKAVLQHFKKSEDCADLIDAFPAMHCLIIDNVASKEMYADIVAYRKKLLADINDWDFYSSTMKQLCKKPKYLYRVFSNSVVAERLSIIRYCLDNNYTALRIRNKVIYQLSNIIDAAGKNSADVKIEQVKIRQQKKKLFLIGTEEYGNIGDNQINESTVAFLIKALPDYTLYEITALEWGAKKEFWKKCISKKDLIAFAGGGNFGDTYPGAHELRAEVIRLFPKNYKIVFPQTIYYSDTDVGRNTLARDKALFTMNHNITIVAREQGSYETAKKEFACPVILAPDIVLSTEVKPTDAERSGILLCMRSDKEKVMADTERTRLENICCATGLEVSYTDLQLDYNVKKAYRRTIIDQKFQHFKDSRIVITDRLHGMIFAAITGTPCIVFSNFNHKVRGTYEWIQHLPYIRYAETVADVEKYLPDLLAMERCQYSNAALQPHFDQLEKVVKEHACN